MRGAPDRRSPHFSTTSTSHWLHPLMSTVYLFYKAFCILKLKVALISCRWSKALLKAGENNGLIRPPADCVPDLYNREIAPISSTGGVGVKAEPPLDSPLGNELLWVIGLTYAMFYLCVSSYTPPPPPPPIFPPPLLTYRPHAASSSPIPP